MSERINIDTYHRTGIICRTANDLSDVLILINRDVINCKFRQCIITDSGDYGSPESQFLCNKRFSEYGKSITVLIELRDVYIDPYPTQNNAKNYYSRYIKASTFINRHL